jgi:hypothetical protein
MQGFYLPDFIRLFIAIAIVAAAIGFGAAWLLF